MEKTIILASQSKQRKILMETLGIPFEIMPADIDEQAIVHENPVTRAKLIAQAKAHEIESQWRTAHPEEPAVIIAADTYCFMGTELFEKPVDKDDAIRMITALSGKTSTAVTGFCLLETATHQTVLDTVETKMTVRSLSDEEIEYYVKHNEVTQWSGGFSPAYHAGMALFESVSGSLTSFSHGFPMEKIVPALRELGVEL